MAKRNSTNKPYLCVFLFDTLYLYRLIDTMQQLIYTYMHTHTQMNAYKILTAILLGRHYFCSRFIDEETGAKKK